MNEYFVLYRPKHHETYIEMRGRGFSLKALKQYVKQERREYPGEYIIVRVEHHEGSPDDVKGE